MPRFSVIIPFHNAADTLDATLQSLQEQSFDDWEAICVDDRSTDGSDRIVSRYAACDHRIVLRKNVGVGPSNARNVAAQNATGTYLSFCDADDLWTPHRLSDLNAAFRETRADGLFGRVAFFRDRPDDATSQSTVPGKCLTISDLLGENPVCTMSNLTVSAAGFQRSGGLDPSMIHNEDLEFLIRFIGTGHRIEGLDRLHVWYRTSQRGLSSNLAAMFTGRECAITAARAYGVETTPAQEAIYMRYLARRSLRLGHDPRDALHFTKAGLARDPRAFMHPLRRGGLTTLAAFIAPILPLAMRHSLFAR
ncbi:MAG: glycosyltransferase family 2 protein [Paracoccaceae bacterium]|nr:glycosyltransferase family 2 protein [Paracoccaceae bacterium]